MFGPHLNHLSTCSSYCRRINLPCLRYWGTVTAAPSRDLKGQRFAYHNWDFTAAAEVFTHYDKHYQVSQKDMAKGCKGKMLGASSRWIDRDAIYDATTFRRIPLEFHWGQKPTCADLHQSFGMPQGFCYTLDTLSTSTIRARTSLWVLACGRIGSTSFCTERSWTGKRCKIPSLDK